MKKYIALLLLLFNIISYANDPIVLQEQFEQANNYYKKEQYKKAIESYLKLAQKVTDSPELYYNLGNAYFKTKQDVEAVYYYEKALLLAPSDKDILTNLDHAKANLEDDITIIKKYNNQDIIHQSIGKLTPDDWAFITTILAFVLVAFFGGFYLAKNPTIKRIFFCLFILGILSIGFTTYCAYFEENFHLEAPSALLWQDTVELKQEPRSNSETIIKLHKGTKVYLLEDKSLWVKVKLDNLEQGWVPKKSLKNI